MDHDDAVATAVLRPARTAVLARRLGAAVSVGALIAAFLLATWALPDAAALAIGAGLGGVALWVLRRASAAAQSGVVATAEGVVVRAGTASAELAWSAVEAIRPTGAAPTVSVEIIAGRVQRELPRAFAPDDVAAFLHDAARLATDAGHDSVTVRDGELSAG